MKVYSIGREEGCAIVINDNTNVISRRHAVLNVTSSGKMTIVDQSHNGTYVNGIRISPNVPVPVTRKDNISFAHVARLDWNLIPNPQSIIMKWVIVAVVAILLIIGGVILYNYLSTDPEPPTPQPTMYTPEELERRAKEKSDSIQKQVRDSLRRDSIRRDSIKKAEKERKVRPISPKKDPEKGKKTETKKDETPKAKRLGR